MTRRIKGIIVSLSIGIVLCLFVFGIYFLAKTDYEFEIRTRIKAKILVSSDSRIGIQYNLYQILILEDWNQASPSYVKHLKDIYNEKGYIELDLYVHDNQTNMIDPKFQYFYPDGILLFTTYQPLEDQIIKYNEKIPGFRWLIKDGKKVTYNPIIERGNTL